MTPDEPIFERSHHCRCSCCGTSGLSGEEEGRREGKRKWNQSGLASFTECLFKAASDAAIALHVQALKELREKAGQKGTFGGAGLKMSGKKK